MGVKTMAVLGAICGMVLVSGCATSRAPMTASGEKIKIFVLSDRGSPDKMEEKQWGYRNEVGSYMETDLINRLNRTGYNATLVKDKSEIKPLPDSYTVFAKIKSYNPGSAAARIVVGFGAGACSLDMHYKVFNADGAVIMEWDDGIGTSGDWRRLPIALNDKLVRKLNEELAAP